MKKNTMIWINEWQHLESTHQHINSQLAPPSTMGLLMEMDLCISTCMGNMLISMMIGGIIVYMIMRCMDNRKKNQWVKEMKTYKTLGVDELRLLLKLNDLPVSGLKEDMIRRLIKHNMSEKMDKMAASHDVAKMKAHKETLHQRFKEQFMAPEKKQQNIEQFMASTTSSAENDEVSE